LRATLVVAFLFTIASVQVNGVGFAYTPLLLTPPRWATALPRSVVGVKDAGFFSDE
jgi:hypothetical protein